MSADVVVLVPPAPAPSLGAFAAAALFAGRGRTVTLLEPAGTPDPERPEEPFLLPVPDDGRADAAGRLVSLLATAARLGPLDRLVERLPVPCQVILRRHRLDVAADPATLAAEVAREWPEASSGFAAIEREIARLDAALATAPPRLLVGSPTRLGRAGDVLAFLHRPGPWVRGRKALAAPVPSVADPAAAAGLAALALGLGGTDDGIGRLAGLWRPWTAARRGAVPRAAGGLAAHLRARAVSAGARSEPYDPDALALTTAREGLAVRTAPGAGLVARLLVSAWPAAGLAPRAEGRPADRLTRLAAVATPRRWAARLILAAPRAALPVGLGRRAVLTGDDPDGPDPLLLEVDPVGGDAVRLGLTALVDNPAAPPDLAARLRRRLEWLVPFLPAETEGRLIPPDARWPVRFAAPGTRPVRLPPLAWRHLALVGPDVAPGLGPEGEVLAALAVVGALAPS
ncbi:MAG TPA: hypothetical protein VF406_02715 [Thermodesulfobacteriota bacterium]